MSSARSARPRLLVLTPDFPPAYGGVQLLVHRLAQLIAGFEVEVVALPGPGVAEFDRLSGVRTRRVHGVRRGRTAAAVAALNAAGVRHAWRFRPQVVLSAHVVVSPAAAMVQRVTGARTVQYFYAVEVLDKPRLTRFAANRADLAIAISEHTAALVKATGAARGNLNVVAPGVDLPSAEPPVAPARSGATDRATHASQERHPIVLTIAQLRYAYKGHDVLIRALARVRRVVPDVEWIVVGDGPLLARLEELAHHEGLGDVARFLGSISNAERDAWLARADVLAMPSRGAGEGFGIAYLEAGAHGKPVLAGDTAGAREAVVDGVTGLLVDPTDPEAVAEGLERLLLDSDLARRLGRAGAVRARTHAWPLIAARVEAALLELVPTRA